MQGNQVGHYGTGKHTFHHPHKDTVYTLHQLQKAKPHGLRVSSTILIHTVDREIFVTKKFLPITFNDKNQTGEIFFDT